MTSAPTSGESVRAGERIPPTSPTSTVATTGPITASGSDEWCSKAAGPDRVVSGCATQSWRPWRAPVEPFGVSSAWATPRPAVIRLSWPGLMSCSLPRLSWWTTSPSRTHVTVWRPMCGCGPTSIDASATSAGPKWSTKHQGPMVRRSRRGRDRTTGRPPTSVRRPSPTSTGPLIRGLPHLVAVHGEQLVGDQLHPGAVGVGQVDRGSAGLVVRDPGGVELALEVGPPLRGDRDGDVVQPAEHLGVGPDIEAGEVEEGQQVAVADVEEEVVRALVVAVLEDLGQGEFEQLLVEADRLLDVGRDQGDVVHAPGGRLRPLAGRLEVAGDQLGPAGLDDAEIDALGDEGRPDGRASL